MSIFDTGIRPVIDDYLAKKQAEKRSYGDYWSASQAGYCMRKLMFERLGVPPVNTEGDERKTRVFESGHIFHKWLQDITKEAGLSIAQELELQDEELMIRGHIDDLVLVSTELKLVVDETPSVLVPDRLKLQYTKAHMEDKGADKHLILYDYKTAHSRSFHYAKDRPMSHYHRMQVGTYMYMLRNIARHDDLAWIDGTEMKLPHEKMIADLTEARVMSISKDDLCMLEKQLLWTPDLEKDVVRYWKTLNGYWNAKKFPRCTCADYEKNSKTGIGFMADAKYNPYFRDGEPCNMKVYEEFKLKKEG